MSTKKIFILILLFSFLFFQMANAAISSKQSGPWTSASTWEGNVVPTNFQDVIIKSGHTVTRNNAFVSQGILFVYGTMVYQGNVARSFYPGTDIEIQGTIRVEGGSFYPDGLVYGNGTFRQTAGSTTFGRAYVVENTDIQGGTVFFQNINNGNLYLDNLTIANATLSANPITDLHVTVSMHWNGGGKVLSGTQINIADGVTLTFDSGLHFNDGYIKNYGTISSAGGSLDHNAGTGTIYNHALWQSNVSSGTMTVGNQTIYNIGTAEFRKQGAGSILFASSSSFLMEYSSDVFKLLQGNCIMKAPGISPLNGYWRVDAGCTLHFTSGGATDYAQFIGLTFVNNGQVTGSPLRFTGSYITAMEGDGKYDKIEIDKSGGEVALTGSPEVVLNFTLSNGRIVLHDHDLRLGNADISFSSNFDSYIQTNGTGSCAHSCAAGNPVFLPIGNNDFAPFAVQMNAGSTTDIIKVRVVDSFYGEYNGNTPGCSDQIPVGVIGHTWVTSEQTPGGSNAIVAAYWIAGAERNEFDSNSCTLGQYLNGNWQASTYAPAGIYPPLYVAFKMNATSFTRFGIFDESHQIDVNFDTPTPDGNAPLCEWSDLQLHANTSEHATIHWTGPNGFQSNEQDPIISGIQPGQGGLYVLQATQYGCPTQQASVNVQVNPEPTVSITGPVQALDGESVTLTALGGSSFVWSTGATTQSITVTPTQTTDYQATVFTAAGCSATVVHTVQVTNVTASQEAEEIITQVKITPNPATDATLLTFESDETGEAEWIIMDARGAQLMRRTISVMGGVNLVNIPLQTIPAGTYQLTLKQASELKTMRIVKIAGK